MNMQEWIDEQLAKPDLFAWGELKPNHETPKWGSWHDGYVTEAEIVLPLTQPWSMFKLGGDPKLWRSPSIWLQVMDHCEPEQQALAARGEQRLFQLSVPYAGPKRFGPRWVAHAPEAPAVTCGVSTFGPPDYDFEWFTDDGDMLSFTGEGAVEQAKAFAEKQAREVLRACTSPLNLRAHYISTREGLETVTLAEKDARRMSSWESFGYAIGLPS